MAVFLSPVFGVAGQLFDDNGNPLAGGKIYTYLAGTTTPAATYTSSSGSIAHTNPLVLDGAGRVPSGEIWLTDGIQYKFVVEDANNVLIGTYDNLTGINSNFVAFTNEQEIQTATAGQTVFNLTTVTYQPGTNSLSVFVDGVNQYGPGAQYAYVETDADTVTFVSGLHVGASVKFTTSQLNTSGAVDAAQVTYTPPFTGAVPSNVENKLAQTISFIDFGADPTGALDSAPAFNAAIAWAVSQGVGVFSNGQGLGCAIVAGAIGATFKIESSVLVCPGLDIDLQGAQLIGQGYGISDNHCFESATVSGGVLVPNDGSAPLTNLISCLSIRNAHFQNFNRALSLWGCIEGCIFENMTYYNCRFAIYTVYPFYSIFHNHVSRGAAGGATNGAYHFDYFSNVIEMDSLFCIDRQLGFEFFNACDALQIRNCSVEGGVNGMLFGSEVNKLTIDNCYFENLSGLVFDFTAVAGHRNITISNCFFNALPIGSTIINGTQMGSGSVFSKTNHITPTVLGTIVFNTDNVNSSWTVELPDVAYASNASTVPTARAGYTISTKANVTGRAFVFDNGTGLTKVVANQPALISNPVPLTYFGTAGEMSSIIPFCSTAVTGSGASTVFEVQTRIAHGDYAMAIFALTIQEPDTSTFHSIRGRSYGLAAYLDAASGKTCTVTNVGGYLKFAFGNFNTTINPLVLVGGIFRMP